MRSHLLSLLLVLPLAAPAANVPVGFREGEEALNSGLWEIAALRFNRVLQTPGLASSQKPAVAIRLAEALIRNGTPGEALILLRQPAVATHPESYFWTAQALAASGRLAEAMRTFASALDNPQAPYRQEAILSRASLQRSLNQSAAAQDSLKALASDPNPTTAALAQLHQAEIFLDLGDAKNSRLSMPEAASIAPAERSQAAFLEARLLLAEAKPEAAGPAFSSLLEHPQDQSLTRYHAAALGLADSLAAQGSPSAASKSLLTFIQAHPDSPLLGDMFKRLLQWLPATPALTDPVLEQLAQWIPPLPPPAASALNTSTSNAIAAWPVITEPSELAPFALYSRAIGLHRLNTPEAKITARRLMTRLRLDYPSHFLASHALLETGRWLLDQGHANRALAVLASVRESAKSPALIGEATFLSALAAFTDGETKQAIRLFDEASHALTGHAADSARLNAAITRLHSGETLSISTQENPKMAPDTVADLELEQALAATPPAAAKSAISDFLTHYPEHPRLAEARLAAVNAALSTTPPDLVMARAQLDSLSSPASDALPAEHLALARLRCSDLSNEPKATIAAAKAFIESFPKQPAAADAALVLGRNLFQSGDYNAARMTLEKLASADTTPTRAQAAWLLAARSAALVPSPQSREEALLLFDRAIAINASLASIARLEKARLMIDLNHLADASSFLRKWHASLPKDDPLRLPAGFLLGETLTAQAVKKPELLTDVLDLYQKLLTHPKVGPATRHRLQYLRGQTLEQLPNPKAPSTKRVAEALEAYYSVLEAATKTPPAEWEWFERCGFRALEIYESAKRWQPAIAIANKIASFKGPRADEAASRARALQLKHMVWED